MAAFLAAGFFAAAFLAAGFFAAGFLAAGFLAAFLAGLLAAFLAAGFLAAFLGDFLAAAFFGLAAFLAGDFGFLTTFFFGFLATFGFSPSLKEPAAPDHLDCLRDPALTPAFRAVLRRALTAVGLSPTL